MKKPAKKPAAKKAPAKKMSGGGTKATPKKAANKPMMKKGGKMPKKYQNAGPVYIPRTIEPIDTATGMNRKLEALKYTTLPPQERLDRISIARRADEAEKTDSYFTLRELARQARADSIMAERGPNTSPYPPVPKRKKGGTSKTRKK